MTLRVRLAPVAAWVLLVVLDVVLLQLARSFGDFLAFAIPMTLFTTVTGTVGLLIRLRRPENRVGRLMALGPTFMLTAFIAYAAAASRYLVGGAGDVPGGLAIAYGSAFALPAILLTFPAVGLLFPDGHLPSPRWRPAVVVIGVLMTASAMLGLVGEPSGTGFPHNPLAIPGHARALSSASGLAGTLGLLGTVILTVAAVIVRFRRSHGAERQQLKWFAASIVVTATLFPVSFLTDVGPADLIDELSVLSATLVPIAIGIAILRYRLYDIDRLISRGLSWALLTVALVAVYAGVVLVLQGLLEGVTQGATLAVAASTLAAAALFQPLRSRIQHTVDRRFDRARYDAERTTSALAERLRDQVDLEGLRADVAATVTDALRPRMTGLWIRGAGEGSER